MITGKLSKNIQLSATMTAFAVWFVIDSLFLANPDMPFLRARQMMAFPCGIFIAMYKDLVEQYAKKPLMIIGAGITGMGFMAITQLDIIKNMPYLTSNVLSLFTVMPLAIAILGITAAIPMLLKSGTLRGIGVISYEIYLIHAFTLTLVKTSILHIVLFLIVTVMLAILLHQLMKMKDGLIRN